MELSGNRVLYRYRNRQVTCSDLEDIRSVVAAHYERGRSFIARSLCERWDWRQANGRLKELACRDLLLRLEEKGHLRLPPRIREKNNLKRKRFGIVFKGKERQNWNPDYRLMSDAVCKEEKLSHPVIDLVLDLADAKRPIYSAQDDTRFRDAKTHVGVGQAQVWNNCSIERTPAFLMLAYSSLLLASILAFNDERPENLFGKLPKWRRDHPLRPSCKDLLRLLRHEVAKSDAYHPTQPEILHQNSHHPEETAA